MATAGKAEAAGSEGLGGLGFEMHSTLLSLEGIATATTTGGKTGKRSVEHIINSWIIVAA